METHQAAIQGALYKAQTSPQVRDEAKRDCLVLSVLISRWSRISSAFWISFLHLQSKERYCSLGGLVQIKSIFHNVPLEGVRVSRCSGIAIPANAAVELVKLVADACWGFVFALFDPKVSHCTTKTPNTTAIVSIMF